MLKMCRVHNPKSACLIFHSKSQIWQRKLLTQLTLKRSISFKASSLPRKSYFFVQPCKKSSGYISSFPFMKGVYIPCRFVSSVKNHYEVLGLGQNASSEDIRAAFLQRSKECHPDLNRSNPENHRLFVQVNEAYSVLSKPQTRKHYDSALNHSAAMSGPTPSYSNYYHHPKHTSQEEWLRQHGLKEEYFRHTSHQQHGNQEKRKISNIHIVASCLVFMLTGMIFHLIAVKQSSEKHIQNLNERDLKTHEIWMNAKKVAKEFTPRELTQHLVDKKQSQTNQPGR